MWGLNAEFETQWNKEAGSAFWFPVPVFSRSANRAGGVMRRLLQDIVLFSCLAAFVTGVVIAAATLFG
jgi:hypothetical protein